MSSVFWVLGLIVVLNLYVRPRIPVRMGREFLIVILLR